MKRHKQKKKKYILFTILFFLFFIVIFIFLNQKENYGKIEKYWKDLGNEIENFMIPKLSPYDEELMIGINRELEEENKELSEMLEIKFPEYQLIYATVIKREIDWYQEITINKGEKDGIAIDMAVISNHGLIGKVIKTTAHSSVVKLLSANQSNMKVAVDIKNKTETIHGIIDGYLIDENFIQVSNISKNYNIEVGDSVYTNGLGGIYPTGIYIGTVAEITYDSLGLSKVAKVKADVSYEKLRYVSVVDRR